MTACTPFNARAAAVSMDLMRPCAIVLRKIFPCSMPGICMPWTYCARPVTFALPSTRGGEVPTGPAVASFVVMGFRSRLRLSYRPRDVHAHELPLVRRGAVHARNHVRLLGRHFPCAAR